MLSFSETKVNCSRSKKVVIIGAGMAGLAAAHTLSTADNKMLFDIKLLEAKPCPGGRVRSVPIQDRKSIVELGARFLYDYKKTAPNFAKFLESRQLTSNTTFWTHSELLKDSTIHLLSNGEEIDCTFAKHYKTVFVDVMNELAECSSKEDWYCLMRKHWPGLTISDMSLEKYFDQRFFKSLSVSPSGQCTPKHIYDRMITYEIFMDGAKLVDVDVNQFFDFQDPDGEYLEPPTFATIVDSICNELPPDTLQCSRVVKSINWTDKAASKDKDIPPITVLCENNHKYEADHVIITTSLGVLKMWASNDMFNPSLPTDKLNAISKLGMGNGCSVYYEFSSPLIDKEHSEIEFFWCEEDKHPTKYRWLQSLDSLTRVSNTFIYGFWLSGSNAKGFEEASESTRLKAISFILKKFLKKTVTPISVISGFWMSDPYTRGTYSYCANGSCQKDRVTLAKPIHGATPFQLLFAGEATHPTIFSTVNGAFETGVQQANLLLE